jgi:hypothetical protein
MTKWAVILKSILGNFRQIYGQTRIIIRLVTTISPKLDSIKLKRLILRATASGKIMLVSFPSLDEAFTEVH